MGFEFSALKWIIFICFVCIGIARCPVTMKVLNSYDFLIKKIRKNYLHQRGNQQEHSFLTIRYGKEHNNGGTYDKL